LNIKLKMETLVKFNIFLVQKMQESLKLFSETDISLYMEAYKVYESMYAENSINIYKKNYNENTIRKMQLIMAENDKK
jgi:hypothetical protein